MRVKYLTANRKRLNAFLIIATVIFFAPLAVVSFLLFFGQAENFLAMGLIVISLTAFALVVIFSLLGLLIRPHVTLLKDSFYELEINTDKDLSAITKANEIQYCGNFIKNGGLNMTIEIDNQVTFKLLNEKIIQFNKIQVKKRKTNMLQESPKAILNDLFVSLGSLG